MYNNNQAGWGAPPQPQYPGYPPQPGYPQQQQQQQPGYPGQPPQMQPGGYPQAPQYPGYPPPPQQPQWGDRAPQAGQPQYPPAPAPYQPAPQQALQTSAKCPKRGCALVRCSIPAFNCDECRTLHRAPEQSWGCRGCDYDICDGCAARQQQQPAAPQPLPQAPYQPPSQPPSQQQYGPRCRVGHQMQHHVMQSFRCDVCTRTFRGIASWGCRTCDFDMCEGCAQLHQTPHQHQQPIPPQPQYPPAPAPYQPAPQQALQTSAKCPKRGCALVRCSIPAFNCDECRTLHRAPEQSWGCRGCDYDICDSCAARQQQQQPAAPQPPPQAPYQPPAPPAQPQIQHPAGTPLCPSGHVMSHSWIPAFRCDGCSSLYQRVESWGCRDCDHDLCDKCGASRGWQKPSKPPVQHPSGGLAAPKPPRRPSVAEPEHSFRALFIGINYPNTRAELSGCHNDVRVMRRLLEAHHFPLEDSKILVDDPRFPGRAGHPDKRTILRHLAWLVEGAKPGDTLFLHYSGHGGQLRDQDGDEDDGMDETLIPADYEHHGQIRDDDIYNIVCRDLPEGVRLTSVMDCCHSGTLMDLQYHWVPGHHPPRRRPPPRRQQGGHRTRDFMVDSQKVCHADVLLFSGCKDTQTSADVGNTSSFHHQLQGPGKAGGACTNAMAEILMDRRGNPMRLVELLQAMQGNLKQRKFSQIPQLSCSKKFDESMEFDFFGPLPMPGQ